MEEGPEGAGERQRRLTAVWKVGGKMFAIVPIEGDPASISLSATPKR